MRILGFISVATLICLFVLAACQTAPGPRTGDSSDPNGVSITVFAYMITNAGPSTLVCFVEAQEPIIRELRKRCGTEYIIEPVSMAVKRPGASDNTLPPGEEGFYFKNSSKEGVLLHVEVTNAGRRRSEAVGTYQGRLSGAGFRYKLERTAQGWSITSVERIAAI